MISKQQVTPLKAKEFENVIDGPEIHLYTITNNKGISISITNLGAKVVAIVVPDRDGHPTDVVLGHDSIADYVTSQEAYFGAICGRYANRIAKGKFTLDGHEYTLAVNNGPNHLHGGTKGFNAVTWEVLSHTNDSLKLRYISKEGDEGYPGELKVTVTYTATDENGLEIHYEAETDAPTVLNLTNHSYFNLNGEGNASVHDHLLMINASTYLPTDDTAIPYGPSERVAGTPFDFRAAQTIGERIDTDIDQLNWARGYDHTYIIDKPLGEYGLHAICYAPATGIALRVESDQPGMQLYTGNWMTGQMRGKGQSRYPARAAVCFETQHYPDSPNKPSYPSVVLRPGEMFDSKTTFTFSTSADGNDVFAH